jgi:hypothetical protein
MRAILSAHNLAAASLCPGKPNAERGLADTYTIYCLKGINLHPYFQTSLSRDALSPDDRELMEASDRLSEQFIAQFRAEVELTDDDDALVEHEIALEGIVPGHPDTVMSWRDGEIVAVLDLKSGMMEVEDAPSNFQLAAYSALVWNRKPFNVCGVAIVQPNALGPRLTSAIYTAAQMPAVLAEIARIRDATLPEDAPRIPSDEACHWCKAKSVCSEFKATFLALAEQAQLAVSTLSNEKLVEVKRAIKFAKKIADEVDDEMRRRIDADSLPGWKLKNTGDVTHLVYPTSFFTALNESLGNVVTATEFDACRKMTWGELKKLIAAKTGISENKADETMKLIAEPFCTKTPKEKAVVADKPTK